MRIAFNARSILHAKRTGIGRYAYHLLNSLGSVDQNNEYWLYVKKKILDFKRSSPKFPYPNFKIKLDLWGIGRQQLLKNADIYHGPSPEAIDIQGPKIIVTIHDLIHKIHPQSHTQETIDLTEMHMQQIIKKADHVICISKSTREDLHRFYDIPAEKSSVVYNGVDHEQFYCLNDVQRQKEKYMLAKTGIIGPFILFVGTIEPRKNLAGLLESFALLRQQGRFNGKLVVVGMKGWMTQSIEPLIDRLRIKEHVVFLGFVDDDLLRVLYNFAEVFVFPSFYEGFGFPIIEAFCCGSPVVTSNASACREISGEAALLIDPHNPQELAEAIQRVVEDENLRDNLKQKGLKKAQQFSFSKTAQETLRIYNGVTSQAKTR